MLGRWEPQAIRLYRDRFIDLDALAVTIDSLAPDAARILEIGCGDGALATALWNRRSRRLNGTTDAGSYLGIDPGIADPGRMYAGDTAFATFRAMFTGDLIAESSRAFDLVIACDVLHHVPDDQRLQLLVDAAALTAPAGTLAVKEWLRESGWKYYAGFLADRYISGDRSVRFMPHEELSAMVEHATPESEGWRTTCETFVPPRKANVLLTRQRRS